MKNRKQIMLARTVLLIIVATFCAGCSLIGSGAMLEKNENSEETDVLDTTVKLGTNITKIEDDLEAAKFEGEDGFTSFLNAGGASSNGEVIEYLSGFLTSDLSDVTFADEVFGCSTLSVKSGDGRQLFGRNFDWQECEALVLVSKPTSGYDSISTVNMDFIKQGAGAASALLLSDDIKKSVALYAPLDGMNEEGFCVSVNMIEDEDTIEQNTEKPDVTTTTAIRLLLNQAANVDEALELLNTYDLHASFGYMVHFAMADSNGNSVVVEYVNNEMVVTETPVVTNFYLAEGEKHGIGSSQSHERYKILEDTLTANETLSKAGVRDALDSVSKDNFEEFASTEWSIVFDQTEKTAQYFHREDYKNSYSFILD